MAINITRGTMGKPQKVVIYGPEGVGKTLLAAEFPGAAFIDVEGSTEGDPKIYGHIARMQKPKSWTELTAMVQETAAAKPCGTLVLDTADWAEKLCGRSICAKYKWDGLESPGYGKGYSYLAEEWARFLDLLTDVRDAGMNVVVIAHATLSKFEQPDERGAYDRWTTKLYDGKNKSNARMLMEWADAVLFCNYKTMVEVGDDGKAKARGSKRTMYTQHHACWDAKNRWGLPEEVPLDYASIAEHIPDTAQKPHGAAARPQQHGTAEQPQKPAEAAERSESAAEKAPAWWAPALRLMEHCAITPEEVRAVSASRGHFTLDTPIANMPKEYIDGCVVPNWAVFEAEILKMRDENDPVPF